MTKTWFISDTHFGHANILKYDERPFADLEEMQEEIIKRWNKKVKNGDTVWFLGDFAFTNKKDYIQPILKRLNGIKNIVMGNHDTKSPQFYRDCGFNEAYNHPIILRNFFILSHEPMFITQNMPYFNIYGHVHNHPAYINKTENTCCVCCSRWNYEPIRIDEFDKYVASHIDTEDLVDMLIFDENDVKHNWMVECRYCGQVDNYEVLNVSLGGSTAVVNVEDTDFFITASDNNITTKNGDIFVEMSDGTNLRFYRKTNDQ